MYLKRADGVEFRVDTRSKMRKSAVSGKFVVDGVEVPFVATSNAKIAPADKVIARAWFVLDGKPCFVKYDYGMAPKDGEVFAKCDGAASRPNPVKVARDATMTPRRVESWRATMAARAAEKLVTPPAAEPPVEPPKMTVGLDPATGKPVTELTDEEADRTPLSKKEVKRRIRAEKAALAAK